LRPGRHVDASKSDSFVQLTGGQDTVHGRTNNKKTVHEFINSGDQPHNQPLYVLTLTRHAVTKALTGGLKIRHIGTQARSVRGNTLPSNAQMNFLIYKIAAH